MVTDVTKQAYNRKEAAKYLGVAENTLVKLGEAGEVNFIQFGRRKIYPKIALDNFLNKVAKGA